MIRMVLFRSPVDSEADTNAGMGLAIVMTDVGFVAMPIAVGHSEIIRKIVSLSILENKY